VNLLPSLLKSIFVSDGPSGKWGTYSDFDDHSILCKFLLIFPFLCLSLFSSILSMVPQSSSDD
jgi:hypothetical protein